MFIVSLTFSHNKSAAPEFMQGHKDWLEKGFSDGVFLLSGNINPNLGGSIIVHGVSQQELQQRLAEDPFVKEGVVQVKVMEISPSKADERLSFLLD